MVSARKIPSAQEYAQSLCRFRAVDHAMLLLSKCSIEKMDDETELMMFEENFLN